MEKKQMKALGVACLVVCAICVFIAIERYNTNVNAVRAINSLRQSSPLGGTMPGGAMPGGNDAGADDARAHDIRADDGQEHDVQG